MPSPGVCNAIFTRSHRLEQESRTLHAHLRRYLVGPREQRMKIESYPLVIIHITGCRETLTVTFLPVGSVPAKPPLVVCPDQVHYHLTTDRQFSVIAPSSILFHLLVPGGMTHRHRQAEPISDTSTIDSAAGNRRRRL